MTKLTYTSSTLYHTKNYQGTTTTVNSGLPVMMLYHTKNYQGGPLLLYITPILYQPERGCQQRSGKRDDAPESGASELFGVLPYHSNLNSSWYGIRTVFIIAQGFPESKDYLLEGISFFFLRFRKETCVFGRGWVKLGVRKEKCFLRGALGFPRKHGTSCVTKRRERYEEQQPDQHSSGP